MVKKLSSDMRRFSVFSLVGTGGFVIQIAALSLLTRVFGWHYGVATLLAIELAILNSFFAHVHWTWPDRRPSGRRQWVACWARYQAAKSAMAAANLGLTAAIVMATRAPVELANTGAVVVCSLLGYAVSDRFIFTEDPAGKAL